MAGFIFEEMTQADAGAFKSTDTLVIKGDANAVSAVFTKGSGLTVDSVSVTVGTTTLTFAASALTPTNTTFLADGTHAVFQQTNAGIADSTGDGLWYALGGTSGGHPLNYAVKTDAAINQVIHGADGNDIINSTGLHSGIANAAGNDHVYGGAGDDEITLGNGNSHVYGGLGATGGADGNDVIVVGTGSNYINGNAGDDTITVGAALSTGSNRVQGGADDDTINIQGAGVNSANGNKGDDHIDAHTSTGSNTLHGGQGDDTINTGVGTATTVGSNVVSGDLGDDTIIVTSTGVADHHLAILTGGDGADTFDFSAGTAGTAFDISSTGTLSGAVYGSHTYYQEITDFNEGDGDTIAVGISVTASDLTALKTTFANVHDAQQAAASDSHAVVATQVGGDTYLFWNGADSVVKLDHTTAADLDFHAFA